MEHLRAATEFWGGEHLDKFFSKFCLKDKWNQHLPKSFHIFWSFVELVIKI